VIWALAARLLAQEAAFEEGRFYAVDIYVNSGSTPLAAWQVQFAATNGDIKIVGIEGGEHPAFKEPPFYDPKAMQHERVIIAAFSTKRREALPTGNTRVATIHLQITGKQAPEYRVTVQAAGNAEGKRINVEATWKERK
jgi:hypothetical protein